MRILEQCVFRIGVYVIFIDDANAAWLQIRNRTYFKLFRIPEGRLDVWLAYVRKERARSSKAEQRTHNPSGDGSIPSGRTNEVNE